MSNPLPKFDNNEVYNSLVRALKYHKSGADLHTALLMVPNLRPLHSEAYALFEEEQKLKEKMRSLAAKALAYLENPEFLSTLIKKTSQEVVRLLSLCYAEGGSKLQLIKLYRDKTGCTLPEARDFIENSGFHFPSARDKEERIPTDLKERLDSLYMRHGKEASREMIFQVQDRMSWSFADAAEYIRCKFQI